MIGKGSYCLKFVSIEEEESFENLRFQTKTQKETEKIKGIRSEL